MKILSDSEICSILNSMFPDTDTARYPGETDAAIDARIYAAQNLEFLNWFEFEVQTAAECEALAKQILEMVGDRAPDRHGPDFRAEVFRVSAALNLENCL